MKLFSLAILAALTLGGCAVEDQYRTAAYAAGIGERYDAATEEETYQRAIQHGTVTAVSTHGLDWPTYTTINY